jgi:hypothetical protein
MDPATLSEPARSAICGNVAMEYGPVLGPGLRK